MKQKINIVITLIFILLTSSCSGNNKQNFDVDLSDIKIPKKSNTKILNQKKASSSSLENKIIEKNLLTYKTKSEVLSSVEIGKKDPFAKEEIKLNTLNIDLKLKGFLHTQNMKYALVYSKYQNIILIYQHFPYFSKISNFGAKDLCVF